WIGDRESEIDASCTGQNGERRPGISAGVMAVCDERCACDLAADLYPNYRDALVTDEAHDRRDSDDSQVTDRLRIHDAGDRLVTREQRIHEQHRHHQHTGQVLHSSVAEREAPARLSTHECEGDPERYDGREVAEIVDHVGEQRGTMRHRDY